MGDGGCFKTHFETHFVFRVILAFQQSYMSLVGVHLRKSVSPPVVYC